MKVRDRILRFTLIVAVVALILFKPWSVYQTMGDQFAVTRLVIAACLFLLMLIAELRGRRKGHFGLMLVIYTTLAVYGGWRAVTENHLPLATGHAREIALEHLKIAQDYKNSRIPQMEKDARDGLSQAMRELRAVDNRIAALKAKGDPASDEDQADLQRERRRETYIRTQVAEWDKRATRIKGLLSSSLIIPDSAADIDTLALAWLREIDEISKSTETTRTVLVIGATAPPSPIQLFQWGVQHPTSQSAAGFVGVMFADALPLIFSLIFGWLLREDFPHTDLVCLLPAGSALRHRRPSNPNEREVEDALGEDESRGKELPPTRLGIEAPKMDSAVKSVVMRKVR